MLSPKVKAFFSFIRKFLAKNRRLILFAFLYFVLFFILLFPFGSLKQILTDTLSSATRGKMEMSFKSFFLNPLSMSLQLKKIQLQIASYPPLEVKQITLKPSLFSLLRKQLSGQVVAKGVFNGNLVFKAKGLQTSKNHLFLKAEGLNLGALSSFLSLDMNMSGQLKYLEAQLQWKKQIPQDSEAQAQFHGQNLHIPNGSLKTAFGNINIPKMDFQQVQGKLELSEGRIHLHNLQLTGSDLDLDLKGYMNVLLKSGFKVKAQSYKLQMKLKVSPNVYQELSFILGFLEKHQKVLQGNYHYNLELSSSNIFLPPQISSK